MRGQRVPFLPEHVRKVFFLSSEIEMIWIYTARIIAAMADANGFLELGFIEKLIS